MIKKFPKKGKKGATHDTGVKGKILGEDMGKDLNPPK